MAKTTLIVFEFICILFRCCLSYYFFYRITSCCCHVKDCEKKIKNLHTLYGGKKAYLDNFPSTVTKKSSRNFVRISFIYFFVGLEIFIPILAQTPGNKQNKSIYTQSIFSRKKQQQTCSNNKKK